ncbi:MAG TPA: hypothetical protein VFH48_06695 [Chloroflexota bacterium]|nr:hypothetical protein [Chloroflexota bacterium]
MVGSQVVAGSQVVERHGAGNGQHRRRGVAVELAIGVVLSVILALVVALAGGAMNESGESTVRNNVIVPVIEVEIQDLDPRDPLVRCTVLETHTHCIREAS